MFFFVVVCLDYLYAFIRLQYKNKKKSLTMKCIMLKCINCENCVFSQLQT